MTATTVTITPVPCGCGRCTSTRRVCWGCCICRRGPFSLEPRDGQRPYFVRQVLAAGGITGVNFEVCSQQCQLELDRIGVPVPVMAARPPDTIDDVMPLDPDELGLSRKAREVLIRLSEGRGHPVARVVAEVLDDIEAQEGFDRFRAQPNGVMWVTQPAASAVDVLDRLRLREQILGRVRNLSEEFGMPPDRIVAEVVEWWFEGFY